MAERHQCLQEARITRDEHVVEKHVEESGPVRESVARHEANLKHLSDETKEIFSRLRNTEIDATYAVKLAVAIDQRVTRHKSEVDRFVESTNEFINGKCDKPGASSRLKNAEDYITEQKNSRVWLIHTIGYTVIGIILAYIAAKLGMNPSQVKSIIP